MRFLPLVTVALLACSPPPASRTSANEAPASPEPHAIAAASTAASATSTTTGAAPAPTTTAAVTTNKEALAAAADGPHISTSAGEAGGIVVLWPRIVPKSDTPEIAALAGQLQQRLKDIAGEVGAKGIDVRPAPQRVCRKPAGCKAANITVLLTHKKKGCAVLALIAKPGASPTHIEPWAGRVTLKADEVPFREYPESQVRVHDYVPCAELLKSLKERQPAVIAKLREALE